MFKLPSQQGKFSIVMVILIILVFAVIIGGIFAWKDKIFSNLQKDKTSETTKPTKSFSFDQEAHLKSTERKLGEVPEDYQVIRDMMFSSDGQHFAFVGQKKDSSLAWVVTDGEEKGPYLKALLLGFSKNNHQWIYAASNREDSYFVVVGDTRLPICVSSYFFSHTCDFVLDSNTGRWMYTYCNASKCFLYFDNGQTFGPYELITEKIFSTDGKHFAFVGWEKEKRVKVVVFDGKKIGEYSSAHDLSFDFDNNLYYLIKENNKSFLVKNGVKISKEFDYIGHNFVFDRDNKHLAFSVEENGEKYILLNGARITRGYQYIQWIQFSPDNKRIFYEVVFLEDNNKGAIMSYDLGKKQEEQVIEFNIKKNGNLHNSFAISQDGRHWGLVNCEHKKDGGAYYIMVDGKQINIEPLSKILQFTFAPENNFIVYIREDFYRTGENVYKYDIENGQIYEGKLYDQITGQIIFDSSGQNFAYRAKKAKKFFIVVNSREGPYFDYVSPPVFSADGQFVSYGALRQREIWWHKDSITDQFRKEGYISQIFNKELIQKIAEDLCSTEGIRFDSRLEDLNEDNIEEVIVFPVFCYDDGSYVRGASYNGPIFIFQKEDHKWEKIFNGGGNVLNIRNVKTNGYFNIETYWHMGATEGTFTCYQWSGEKYEETPCSKVPTKEEHFREKLEVDINPPRLSPIECAFTG